MSTLETVADRHGILSVADGRRAGLGAPDLERLVREGHSMGWKPRAGSRLAGCRTTVRASLR